MSTCSTASFFIGRSRCEYFCEYIAPKCIRSWQARERGGSDALDEGGAGKEGVHHSNVREEVATKRCRRAWQQSSERPVTAPTNDEKSADTKPSATPERQQ